MGGNCCNLRSDWDDTQAKRKQHPAISDEATRRDQAKKGLVPYVVNVAIKDYLKAADTQPKAVITEKQKGVTPLGGFMSIKAPHVMGYKKGKPKGGGKKGK